MDIITGFTEMETLNYSAFGLWLGEQSWPIF